VTDSLTLKWQAIAWLSTLLGSPTETMEPVKARAAMRRSTAGPAFLMGRHPKLASVRDEQLAGVKVRRYLPEAAKPGVLAYFHGGGWVIGDVDSHDGPARGLAVATGREVVSVDYRLAPEHRYPAAFEDVLAVTKALAAQQRVVVAGDSAGGNLAAVVANRCAHDGVALTAQVLLYPVTDCAAETRSYEEFSAGFLLSRETMRYFRREYVPEETRRADPECSPLRAASLNGVAPCYVLLAGCDVLRDEGRAYAKRLQADRVETLLDEVPGVLHGFFNLQGLSEGKAATARVAQWLAPRW
jgi:acetyl esterase